MRSLPMNFTSTMNSTAAVIEKSMTTPRRCPICSLTLGDSSTANARHPPSGRMAETRGMIRSSTAAPTIFPNAAPIITPTARSTTFPLKTKS
jgi:hypothetical protein